MTKTNIDPRALLEQTIDTHADALYALLRYQGFSRESHSARVIESLMVTVSCNANGYRISWYSSDEPSGLAIIDLPMTLTFGTVETIVLALDARAKAQA